MDLLVSLGFVSLLVLSGCSTASYTSSQEKKSDKKEKYQTAAQEIKAFESAKKNTKSQVPPLILPPVYEDISVFGEDTITLSAQNAQFATLLHTVSKISGLNLIIDHDVPTDMPITISVNDADIEEVLQILMDISGCYYELNGNILHIKYYMTKSFLIPYIHTTSSFKTDLGGDVLNSASQSSGSSGGGGSSSGSSGGSSGSGGSGIKGDFSTKFENPNEINSFYDQIEKNLQELISKDEKENEIVYETSSNDAKGTTRIHEDKDFLNTQSKFQQEQKQKTKTTSYRVKRHGGTFILNRFSGVLTVKDRYKNIQAIEEFLTKIKKQINRQVLIEAKILEVILNDSHALGVSWEGVADSIAKAGDKLLLQQGLALTGSVAGTITYTTDNFTAIINALDQSGDVDTLSNPRIKVLSGQSAIISSGKLVPFWEKEVQTNQGTGGSASNTEVTYNRRDVLHGLTMGVTPTIMEDGRIMLKVIPITSSIEDVVNYYDEDGKNVATAPILNIKEAGTVIYAKDNDLVLIGGLINNTTSKKEHKIPWLGDIPGLGAFFKNIETKDEKRELVILIRLKVIE